MREQAEGNFVALRVCFPSGKYIYPGYQKRALTQRWNSRKVCTRSNSCNVKLDREKLVCLSVLTWYRTRVDYYCTHIHISSAENNPACSFSLFLFLISLSSFTPDSEERFYSFFSSALACSFYLLCENFCTKFPFKVSHDICIYRYGRDRKALGRAKARL